MTSETPRVDERLRTTSLMNTLDALNDLYDFARQLERDLAAANAMLDELRDLWPDIRQLQDGFMNGDPNFSEWDHSVRDRCIAMSFKLERKS